MIYKDRALKVLGKGNKERMAYVPVAHGKDWISGLKRFEERMKGLYSRGSGGLMM